MKKSISKMLKMSCLLLAFTTLFAVGCSKKDEGGVTGEGGPQSKEDLIQFKPVKDGEKIAIIKTTKGDIKLRFFPEQAPKAVENFIKLAEKGYYDNVIFHRVMADFMIQTGDPEGTGRGGKSIWGEPFEDEFSNDLYNFRGSVSMANSGADTNGSQFFINQTKKISGGAKKDDLIKGGWPKGAAEKYDEVGGNVHLDLKHTVFAQVFEGLDVVDDIANVATDNNDKPKDEIKINSIEITTYKAK